VKSGNFEISFISPLTRPDPCVILFDVAGLARGSGLNAPQNY